MSKAEQRKHEDREILDILRAAAKELQGFVRCYAEPDTLAPIRKAISILEGRATKGIV